MRQESNNGQKHVVLENMLDFEVAKAAAIAAGVPELRAGLLLTSLRIENDLEKFPYIPTNFASSMIIKGLDRICSGERLVVEPQYANEMREVAKFCLTQLIGSQQTT